MQMEFRMLIAIVLSFLVFFLYQVLFVEEPPVPAPTQETAEQKGPAETPSKVADEGVKPLEESPLPLEVKTPSPSREGRTITVSTPLYVATFTENAGGLKGFRLKRFRESLDAQSPLKEVFRLPEHSDSTLWVSFMGGGLTGLNAAVFEADFDGECSHIGVAEFHRFRRSVPEYKSEEVMSNCRNKYRGTDAQQDLFVMGGYNDNVEHD